MDIVMTGSAGDLGGALLAGRFEEKLFQRFPACFVKQAKLVPEKPAAVTGYLAAVPIGPGGVFGALWRLGEAAETGLYVELSRIPVKQETVEICELLDVTPYGLLSGGLLYITENGNWLPGTVIGRTDPGKRRVVVSEEGTRYLTKPQPDELVRFGWDPESDLWTQDLARGYEAVCLRQATAGKEQQ